MLAVCGVATAPSCTVVVVVADIDEHPRHSTAAQASNPAGRMVAPYCSSRSMIRAEGHGARRR